MPETLQLSLKVTRRHWEIYKKDFLANIFPTVLDPMFFLLALGFGLGAFVSDIDGLSYVRFIAPGLAMSTALFTAFFETSYGFYVRLTFEGIFHSILTTPVGPREILYGELIWVGAKGAMMALGVSLVLSVFGFVHLQYIYLMPLIGATVAVSCGALGLIACALVKNINQFQTVYTLLISPMFFFSGIFYPVKSLPIWAQYVANLSPLYHGVIMAQAALWARDPWSVIPVHFAAAVAMGLISWFIAQRLIYPKLYV